jgi:hypothetical protein
MVKIEFVDNELDVLLGFLQRVDLKGAEVPRFNYILNKLTAERQTNMRLMNGPATTAKKELDKDFVEVKKK